MFGMEKEAVVLWWTASVVCNRALLPSRWFDLFQQQKREYTQDQLQTPSLYDSFNLCREVMSIRPHGTKQWGYGEKDSTAPQALKHWICIAVLTDSCRFQALKGRFIDRRLSETLSSVCPWAERLTLDCSRGTFPVVIVLWEVLLND